MTQTQAILVIVWYIANYAGLLLYTKYEFGCIDRYSYFKNLLVALITIWIIPIFVLSIVGVSLLGFNILSTALGF